MKEEIRNWAHRLASDSVRCGESEYGEQPVAPAPTASAREWLIREDVSNPATVGHHSTHPAVGRAIMRLLGEKNENLLDLEIVLEAYASSQTDKLRGLGQEAANEEKARKIAWAVTSCAIRQPHLCTMTQPCGSCTREMETNFAIILAILNGGQK